MNGWPSFSAMAASSWPNDSRSVLRRVANRGGQLIEEVVDGRSSVAVIDDQRSDRLAVLAPHLRVEGVQVHRLGDGAQGLHAGLVDLLEAPHALHLVQRDLDSAGIGPSRARVLLALVDGQGGLRSRYVVALGAVHEALQT